MMKVGIVTSGNTVNQSRGVGFYTNRLVDGLRNTGELEIDLLKFSRWGIGDKDYDLVHFTYFDPFFLTLPLVYLRPTIVTVHDLTPLILPEGFPRGIRGEIKWQIQKTLLLNSKKIIAVSQQTKSDIASKTHFPLNKIDVIHEAPGNEYKFISQKSILDSITAKYNLPHRFVLYVGDINYNKNLKGLIKAFSVARSIESSLNLVIVGKVYTEKNIIAEVTELKSLISELGLNDRVHFPGYVPSIDLAGIYNLAKSYVQPSIYEGFGLPVVEALACGCPVICGRNSSLPEVGGTAAFYANVLDPKEFGSLIIHVTKLSADETRKVKEANINQAKKFNWKNTAKQTIATYRSVL